MKAHCGGIFFFEKAHLCVVVRIPIDDVCPEQRACTGAAYQHHWQFFRQIIIALCHQLTGHKVRDLFCCLASLIHRLLIDSRHKDTAIKNACRSQQKRSLFLLPAFLFLPEISVLDAGRAESNSQKHTGKNSAVPPAIGI